MDYTCSEKYPKIIWTVTTVKSGRLWVAKYLFMAGHHHVDSPIQISLSPGGPAFVGTTSLVAPFSFYHVRTLVLQSLSLLLHGCGEIISVHIFGMLFARCQNYHVNKPNIHVIVDKYEDIWLSFWKIISIINDTTIWEEDGFMGFALNWAWMVRKNRQDR